MRKEFFELLHKEMGKDTDIWILTGDLGYNLIDTIKSDYPNRFVNCGASESVMLDMACGLSLSGKKVFCYSITPFLLFRPAETIRTYINHENLNVKLIGSGRGRSYLHDGFSHWSDDIPEFMNLFDNIICYYPENKNELTQVVNEMLLTDRPCFLSLER